MSTVEDLAAEVARLRQRVSATEGILAIQALKARYAQLVDARFSAGTAVDARSLAQVADDIASLFTVDGIWDGGPVLGRAVGRAAIASRLRDTTLSFSRHLFVNPRIEVDGDAASARWELLCPCRRADGTSHWMCGYEDDAYTRVEGVWLHRSMTLTTVFMAPTGDGWSTILV